MGDEHAARLRAHLRSTLATSGRPLHPDMLVALEPGGADPTARDSQIAHGETITAELRTVESAFGYYTMESFFVALTPLGMLCVAFAMLQILSGEHGELPEGISPEDAQKMVDPWKELAPFQALAVEDESKPSSAGEECGRALWHLARAYDAATQTTEGGTDGS